MKKIRVLHCVTAMNRGGLETFIMNYYRHIDRKKFEFDFLVQREGEFDYSEEIRRLGGKIYHVPAFNPFRIKKYTMALEGFFAKHKDEYDIVHAHNNSFAMYALRAAKKYNYPVRISHSHIANTKHNITRAPFVFYNKIGLNKVCNARLACGQAAGEWLFNDNDFIIVKNAISINTFEFNKEKRAEYRKLYGISGKTILLGHIGRFEKQKNHKFLINLLSSMSAEGVDARLLLIGEGALKKHIVNMARKEHLDDKVFFAGVVENPNDYLNAMDVFVMPSFHEGLPVTLIEAQSNGLPCIVSDKVSRECMITPLVKFLQISQDAIPRWKKQITKDSRVARKDYSEMINRAGYEIQNATKRLERIYHNLVQKKPIEMIGDMEQKCS